MGSAIGAFPALVGMFPFGREAPNGLAAALGIVSVAGFLALSALAVAVVRWHGVPRRVRLAALALAGAMTVFAAAVVVATWTTGGFGSGRDVGIGGLLAGPLIALTGEALAFGALTIGPARAAVVVGDVWLLLGAAWPVFPGGGPALFGEGGPLPVAWLVAAAFATFRALRGGSQPGGLVLAVFLLLSAAAWPFVADLCLCSRGPDVRPREAVWIDRGDEAGMLVVGSWLVAAGSGGLGWRRHSGRG